MKLNYFFSIFKEDNAEYVLEKFFKTEFFKLNTDYKMVFCCDALDEGNLKYLKNKSKKNKNIKLLIFDKSFSYNDAFNNAIQYFDGDVVLLGDCKIERLDVVFSKCLEKQQKGANVVHIAKRYNKRIKDFFNRVVKSVYNFFIKIFTGKKDRLNIISLGLIDRDVIDVLKELPRKRCFLKNTKDLLGFETRTIYVEEKTKAYKPNFKEKTPSLKITIASGCAFMLSLLLIIVLNCLLNVFIAINLTLAFIVFASLVLFMLFLPKHFFDIRNYTTKKTTFNITEIN